MAKGAGRHRGELISTTTVIADVGGNWTTGFAGVTVNGPLTIESTVAPGDFTALNDDSNFNFRTNYVTGLPGGYFQSRDTSVADAFTHLSYERLDAMSQQDRGETPTEGWRKGDYEFLSQPALPGN